MVSIITFILDMGEITNNMGYTILKYEISLIKPLSGIAKKSAIMGNAVTRSPRKAAVYNKTKPNTRRFVETKKEDLIRFKIFWYSNQDATVATCTTIGTRPFPLPLLLITLSSTVDSILSPPPSPTPKPLPHDDIPTDNADYHRPLRRSAVLLLVLTPPPAHHPLRQRRRLPHAPPVLSAVTSHLRLESEVGGYLAAEEAGERLASVYESIAA